MCRNFRNLVVTQCLVVVFAASAAVADSLEDIRSMVTKLDIPVRQVLIESRIVNADESFTKDLGVNFGWSKDTRGSPGGGSTKAFGGDGCSA